MRFYVCVHFISAVFQTFRMCVFVSLCVFMWIKRHRQRRHINCINELTNSDIFHVFYYFPFCMLSTECWWYGIVKSFPSDILKCLCVLVYGVCMKALNKITVSACDKRIKQMLDIANAIAACYYFGHFKRNPSFVFSYYYTWNHVWKSNEMCTHSHTNEYIYIFTRQRHRRW